LCSPLGAGRRVECGGGRLSAGDLTSDEFRRRWPPRLVCVTCGAAGPTVSQSRWSCVHCTGCTYSFQRLMFKKEFENDFRKR
jgi:hypothetical protein